MLPNEHAPEPRRPLHSPSCARPKPGGRLPRLRRPGDRPPHCRHLRRRGRCRPFSSLVIRRPGSARRQSECAAGRPDRRRRRRLRAGPRGVGPAPREVRRSRHARRPGARLWRDRRPGRAVGDTGHTDFMTPEERTSRNDAPVRVVRGDRRPARQHRQRRAARVTVFHDSPADKAGLRTGDVLLEVDGVPAAGSSLNDVIERIRGESGTPVELTVRAGEDGTPRTLKIVRGESRSSPCPRRSSRARHWPPPDRAVLAPRGRGRPDGAPRAAQGASRPAGPRSPWQPRRLRRRGRRHRQPVPFLGHRLHRAQRRGRGEGHPRSPRTACGPTCR